MANPNPHQAHQASMRSFYRRAAQDEKALHRAKMIIRTAIEMDRVQVDDLLPETGNGGESK